MESDAAHESPDVEARPVLDYSAAIEDPSWHEPLSDAQLSDPAHVYTDIFLGAASLSLRSSNVALGNASRRIGLVGHGLMVARSLVAADGGTIESFVNGWETVVEPVPQGYRVTDVPDSHRRTGDEPSYLVDQVAMKTAVGRATRALTAFVRARHPTVPSPVEELESLTAVLLR